MSKAAASNIDAHTRGTSSCYFNTNQTMVLRAWHARLYPTASVDEDDKAAELNAPLANNDAGHRSDIYIPPLGSGAAARLRRAELIDIGFQPAFQVLFHALHRYDDEYSKRDDALSGYLLIAGLLAEIRQDLPTHNLPKAAGSVEDKGDKPAVSELRFSQLIASQTPAVFLQRTRRVIKQLGAKLSVVDMANDIMGWHREHQQTYTTNAHNRLSLRWAMTYYQTDYQKKYT